MQGEMAELTYSSYTKFIETIEASEEEKITVTYPVGWKPDNTPINSTLEYTKKKLISRYNFLGLTKLPIDGLFQLVTIVETLFGNILRETLLEYPSKISGKRKLDAESVLEATSIDEIKITLINSILNELAYKSPKDYAVEFSNYVSINLLEFPVFHRYIELKATRDIHIHNAGIANEIYLNKADTMARVKNGFYLLVDVQYFLQSYEYCLQLTELLEKELDKIWPSAIYRKNKAVKTIKEEKQDSIKEVIEGAKTSSKTIKKELTEHKKE